MNVSQLNIYPVKSLAGIQLETMSLSPYGPLMDRRFMVVKPNGMFLTQRQEARMSQIDCEIGDQYLLLKNRGNPNQNCAIDYAALEAIEAAVKVTVWNDQVDAVDCGEQVAEFLSSQFDQDLRLVYYSRASQRAVPEKPGYPRSGNFDQVAFADAYPILIANLESLHWLSTRAGFDIEMDRFRANIVIEGLAAFEEAKLGRFQIGEAELEIFSPCSRCTIPAINQQSGAKDANVRSALNSYLKAEDGVVYFGYNAIIHTAGNIKLNDSIQSLS